MNMHKAIITPIFLLLLLCTTANAQNAVDIRENSNSIAANRQVTLDNRELIKENKVNIKGLRNDINTNTKKTLHHQQLIDNNERNTHNNRQEININSKKILNHKELIDTNEKNIIKNWSAINTNSKNINQHKELIDNIKKNAIINDGKNKLNQIKIRNNTDEIRKNWNSITHANGLISQNRERIEQLNFNQHQFEAKTNSKFFAVDKLIDDNHHKAMAGVSSAMSMSTIPFVEGKLFSFGFGTGSYGGQGATALGTKIKLTPNLNVSAYGSYDTSSSVGVAAGISFGW